MKQSLTILGCCLAILFNLNVQSQCIPETVTFDNAADNWAISTPPCAITGNEYSGTATISIKSMVDYSGTYVYPCRITFNGISSNTANSYTYTAQYNGSSYGLSQEIPLQIGDSIHNICLQINGLPTVATNDYPELNFSLKLSFTDNCQSTFAVPNTSLSPSDDSRLMIDVVSNPIDCPAAANDYIYTSLQYVNPITALTDTVNCGKTFIYKYTGNSSAPLLLVDSVSISNMSSFYWSPPTSGNYTALYVPCDSISAEVGLVPTYFSSEISWTDADTLGIGINDQNTLIILTDTILVQGPGIIGGFIFDGKSNKAPGLPNVSVYLKTSTDQFLKYTITDMDGYYEFTNLPYGNYLVYPEIPGVNTTPYLVQINATDTTESSFDFMYSGTEIAPYIDNASISEYNTNLYLQINPNPTADMAYVNFISPNDQKILLQLMDMNGKTVWQKNYSAKQNLNSIPLEITGNPAGIYTLWIKGENISARQKLVVSH